MARSRAVVAAAPLVAVLAALAVTAATGFSQRSGLAPLLGERFYGFFLDRYPLYAAAIVYALARLVAVAVRPGPASLPRRAIGCVVGILAVFAISLHPTFGGFVLRAGFGTGGIAFLKHAPMWAAYGLGTAVAAFVYGAALGFGTFAAGGSLPKGPMVWRRLLILAGRVLLRLLALWFAFAILGLGRDAGIGPWPRQALGSGEALIAAALIVCAFLPHAMLVGIGERAVTSRP